MTTRDPLSPQWEDCKVCGGDHWTKDHPTTRDTPEAALAAALHYQFDQALCLDPDDGCTMRPDYWTTNAAALLAALDGWTLVPSDIVTMAEEECERLEDLNAGEAEAALERIAGSSRTEGGRCVFCGKSDPGKFHDDGCPFEIARATLAPQEAKPWTCGLPVELDPPA